MLVEGSAELTPARLIGSFDPALIILAPAGDHEQAAALADLAGANLVQVLWSSGTLWPADKASLIRDRSEELRPGVWRVVGSGKAEDLT